MRKIEGRVGKGLAAMAVITLFSCSSSEGQQEADATIGVHCAQSNPNLPDNRFDPKTVPYSQRQGKNLIIDVGGVRLKISPTSRSFLMDPGHDSVQSEREIDSVTIRRGSAVFELQAGVESVVVQTSCTKPTPIIS